MTKLLNLLLLLSFLICYLEWGGGNAQFVFQAEYQILFGQDMTQDVATHPFILIPFIGQILLLITLFQKNPTRRLTTIAILLLGLLAYFLLIIGALSMNWKMFLFAAPFTILSILHFRKKPAR